MQRTKKVILFAFQNPNSKLKVIRFEVGSDDFDEGDNYDLFQADLGCRDTLLLVDSAYLPCISRCDTLIVAGCNRIYRKNDVFDFFMPVWTLEELSACRQAIYPHVSQDLLDHQFALWGGSIRLTLQYPSLNRIDECDQKCLESALSLFKPSDASIKALQLIGKEESFLGLILLICVDSDFQRPTISFCSDYAFRLLTQKWLFEEFESSKKIKLI
jgi:hypothetical protein